IRRQQALRQHLQRLRRRRNPTRRAHLPVLADSDLTEIQVHVQPNRSTDRLHDIPPNVDEREKQRANDTDGYVLEAQSGQVAGAATEKHGLEAHRPKRPAHTAFSQESPCPDHDKYAGTTGTPCRAFSCPENQRPAACRNRSRARARPEPVTASAKPGEGAASGTAALTRGRSVSTGIAVGDPLLRTAVT